MGALGGDSDGKKMGGVTWVSDCSGEQSSCKALIFRGRPTGTIDLPLNDPPTSHTRWKSMLLPWIKVGRIGEALTAFKGVMNVWSVE